MAKEQNTGDNPKKLVVETPVGFPQVDANLVKAQNQPNAEQPSPALPKFTDMVPDLYGGQSLPQEVVQDYNRSVPVPADPNFRELNYIRGVNQGFLETMGRAAGINVASFAAGAIEGASYLGDLQAFQQKLSGAEVDYGNWLSDWVQTWRPDASKYIYEKDPKSVDITDSAFWASTASDLFYSQGLMAPAAVTQFLTGGLAAATGMSATGQLVLSSVLAGGAQRYSESLMEAKQASDKAFSAAMNLGYSEEQAKAIKGKVGSNTFNNNMKLMLLDMAQMATIFGGAKNAAGVAANGFKRFLDKPYLTYPFSIGSEAAEELYQYGASEKAYDDALRGTYMPEKTVLGRSLEGLGDPDAQRAMIAGGLGGGFAQAVMPRLEHMMQSKEYKQYVRENKQQLERKLDPEDITKIEEDTFLDLVSRHAAAGKLHRVQGLLESMAKATPDSVAASGLTEEEFKSKVADRSKDAVELGNMYNNIFASKDEAPIKIRQFDNYANKYMIDKSLKRTKERIDNLISEEVDSGKITLTEGQNYAADLIREHFDKKVKPANEYQESALASVYSKTTPPMPGYVRPVLTKDAEFSELVDKHASLLFDQELKNQEIRRFQSPKFQKDFLEAIKRGEEVKEENKKQVVKQAEVAQKKTEDSEKVQQGKIEGTENKRAVNRTKERLETRKRIAALLAENPNLDDLSQDDRNAYALQKPTIDEEVRNILAAKPPKQAKKGMPKFKDDKKGAAVENPPTGTPATLKPVTPASKTVNDVSDKEYANFKEKNTVPKKRLETIAYKVENKQELTTREKEIAGAKQKEVEQAQAALRKKEGPPANLGSKSTPKWVKPGTFTEMIWNSQAFVNRIPENHPDPDKVDKFYVINGEDFDRVSTKIKGEAIEGSNEVALKAGKQIDTIVRDFFNGTLQDSYDFINKDALGSLVSGLAILKDELNKEGLYPIADKLVVFDMKNKVAGELDILLVDKNGNYAGILDTKTSKSFSGFDNSDSAQQYALQLSAYEYMIQTSMNAKEGYLGITPVEVSYQSDGHILEAEVLDNIEMEFDPAITDILLSDEDFEAELRRSKSPFEKFKDSDLNGIMGFDDFKNFILTQEKKGLPETHVDKYLTAEKQLEAIAWYDKVRVGRDEEEAELQRKEAFLENQIQQRRTNNPANNLAVFSRDFTYYTYTDPKTGEERKGTRSISNSLSEGLKEPKLLSPKHYGVGKKLTVRVNNSTATPMYSGIGNREETTWGQYIIDNEIPKEEEYLYVPMEVLDENNKVVAYIHTMDWIHPGNVDTSFKSIEDHQQALADVRRVLANNGVSKIKISKRIEGPVSLTVPIVSNENENITEIPLSEGMPDAEIGIVTADQKKIDPELRKLIAEHTSKYGMEFMAGDVIAYNKEADVVTYVTPDKLQQEEKDSIIEAVRSFILTGITPFSIKVQEDMGLNIKTPAGLRAYLNNFIHITDVQDVYENAFRDMDPKKRPNSSLMLQVDRLVTAPDKVYFALTGNGISWAVSGPQSVGYNLTSNIKQLDTFNVLLENLGKFLDRANLNVNRTLLGKTYDLTYFDSINGEAFSVKTDYTDLIKARSTSKVLGFNIGTEEEPEYVYRLNPTLEFELEEKVVKKPSTKKVKTTPDITEDVVKSENPASSEEEEILRQMRESIAGRKKREGGKRDTSGRPITKEQLDDLKEQSRQNLLIDGIDPYDLERVRDGMSSEIIKELLIDRRGELKEFDINRVFNNIKGKMAKKLEFHYKTREILKRLIPTQVVRGEKESMTQELSIVDEVISNIETLLSNYNYLTKLVLLDISHTSGLKLNDYSDYTSLSEEDVSIIRDKILSSINLDATKSELSNEDDLEDVDNDEDELEDINEEGEGLVSSGKEGAEGWSNIARLKKTAKQSASAALKLFLKTLTKTKSVENIDETYSLVPITNNEFGLEETLNPDDVIEFLLPHIANKNYKYTDMAELLDEIAKDNTWISVLSSALKNSGFDIKRDFFRMFNKVVNNMKYLFFNYKKTKDKKYTETKEIEDNLSETTKLVVRKWASSFRGQEDLIYSNNGEFFVNLSRAKELQDWADKWFVEAKDSVKQTNLPSSEEFYDFMKAFGIELSPIIFNKITTATLDNNKGRSGFFYNDTNLSFKDQFKHEFGIVRNLAKSLSSLTDDDLKGSVEEIAQKNLDSYKLRLDPKSLYNYGVVRALARQEAVENPSLRGNSFFSGNKSVSSHIDHYFIKQRNDIIKKTIASSSSNKPYNDSTYWAKKFKTVPGLVDSHDVSTLSLSPQRVANKLNFNVDYANKTVAEREEIKVAAFFSNTRKKVFSTENGPSVRTNTYFYPPLGSNTRVALLRGPSELFIIHTKNATVDNDLKNLDSLVTQEMIDHVYDYVFLPEARRMMLAKSEPTAAFSTGRKLFYSIPSLNYITELFDSEHNLIHDDNPDRVITNANKVQLVEDAIAEFLKKQISQKLTIWQDFGIAFMSPEGGLYNGIDNEFIKTIKDNISTDENKRASSVNLIRKNIAANYVVNNVVGLASIQALYIGDLALNYKPSVSNIARDDNGKPLVGENGKPIRLSMNDPAYNFHHDVDATIQGYAKRLGTEIGPAMQMFAYDENLKDDKFSVLVVKDDISKISDELIKYYKEVGLPEEEIADFDKSVKTDGVILNHPLEHLESLWRFYKIPYSQYVGAKKYFEQNGRLPANLPITTNKTRYLDHLDTADSWSRIHLKGAEFYISPEMLDGSPLFKRLYDLMGGKDMKIQKIAFESTVKTGKISVFNPFNEDGTISNAEPTDKDLMILDRFGLQLQTTTPNKEKNTHAKLATQLKQLFLDVEGYFPKEIAKFHEHYSNLVLAQKKEFLDSIKFDEETGLYDVEAFSNKILDHIKRFTSDFNIFASLRPTYSKKDAAERMRIQKELTNDKLTDEERSILEGNLKAIKGRFLAPLFAGPGKNVIEPYIMSLVSGIVDNIQIRGNSFTLAPETYLSEVSEGVTYTSAYDPSKGLQHYEFVDSETGKKVKRSQIVISWPFPDLDIKDFLTPEGKIDTKKFPKKLLHSIATRIPVTKQSSMMSLEIVGFLPRNYKGVVVASHQFIHQTSWDFDDDKLYMYFRDYDYVPEQVEVTKDNKKSVEIQRKIVIRQNSDANGLLDVFDSVLLDPRSEVRKKLHVPVSTDPIEHAYELLHAKFLEEVEVSPVSEEYNNRLYASQANVSTMISVAANGMNMHSALRLAPDVIKAHVGLPVIRIAGEVSHRVLGRLEANNGLSISENIGATLQAAVDNPNIGKLAVMNVNPYTYPAINQGTEEALSPNVVYGLVNQDIVKTHALITERLKRANEGYAGRWDVIAELTKVYPNSTVTNIIKNKKFSTEDREKALLKEFDGTNGLENITPDELLSNTFKNDDPIHWDIYIAYLSLFDTGRKLATIQSNINVDSKGYGKTLSNADGKASYPFRLFFEKSIDNIPEILGQYYSIPLSAHYSLSENKALPDNIIYLDTYRNSKGEYKAVYLEPKTVYGIASVQGRDVLNKTLLNPNNLLYPYKGAAFTKMWEAVSDVYQLEKRSAYERNKIKNIVFNQANSYLASSYSTNLYDGLGVTARRHQLNIKQRTSKNLGDLITIAQKDEFLKDNRLIKKLMVLHGPDGETSSIKYAGAERDDLSRNAISTAFYSLLYNDSYFLSGTNVSSRELAEMLVEYAMLNGATQHTDNYIKLIPVDYLQVKGYYDYLYNLNYSEPYLFDVGEYEKDGYRVGSYISQLSRHFPEFVRAEKGRVSTKLYKKIYNLPVPKQYKKRTPPFIKFIDEDDGIHLYQFNGERYYKLELLKAYPDVQYDMDAENGYNIPVQSSLRFPRGSVWPGYVSEEGVSDVEKIDAPSFLPDFNELNELYTKDASPKQILENVLNRTTNPKNKELVKFILETYDDVNMAVTASVKWGLQRKTNEKNLDGTFKYKKLKGMHTYDRKDKMHYLTFNPAQAENSEDYEQTIIHEHLHPIISEFVEPFLTNKKIEDPLIRKNIETLNDIYGVFRNRLVVDFGTARPEILKEKITSAAQEDLINAASGLKEFIDEAISSDYVKEYLNTEVWKGEQGILDKLLSAIVKILARVNIKFGERLGDRVIEILRSQRQAVKTTKGQTLRDMQILLKDKGKTYDQFFGHKREAEFNASTYTTRYGEGAATVAKEKEESGWKVTVNYEYIVERLAGSSSVLLESLEEDDDVGTSQSGILDESFPTQVPEELLYSSDEGSDDFQPKEDDKKPPVEAPKKAAKKPIKYGGPPKRKGSLSSGITLEDLDKMHDSELKAKAKGNIPVTPKTIPDPAISNAPTVLTSLSQLIGGKVVKEIHKNETNKEAQVKMKELIAAYGKDRVVMTRGNVIKVLNEGYIYASNPNFRDAEHSEQVDNFSAEYEYASKELAEINRERLENFYGEGRVSFVMDMGNFYRVEVFSTEDPRSSNFAKLYPRRESSRVLYEKTQAAKKKKSSYDIVKSNIQRRKYELEQIKREIFTKDQDDPSIETTRRVTNLENQIAELEKSLAPFINPKVRKRVESIEKYLDMRLTAIEELVNDPNLHEREMDKILKELHWIQDIGDQRRVTGHPIFGDQWRDAAFRNRFIGYATKATSLEVTFEDRIMDFLVKKANEKKLAGQPTITRADLEEKVKDVSQRDANFFTIYRNSTDALMVLIGREIGEINTKIAMDNKDAIDRVNAAIKKVLAKVKNIKNPFDIFYEKDANGNKTSMLAHFFSSGYQKELDTMLTKARGVKGSYVRRVLPWLKENTNFIDVRKLLPTLESDLYHYTGTSFTDEERSKYAQELKDEYGDYVYNRIVQDMLTKVRRFKNEYQLLYDQLLLPNKNGDVKSLAEREAALEKFANEKSPYVVAEYRVDGREVKHRVEWKYTTQAAKRYKDVNGKKVATGWFNEDFDKITKDKDLLEFYEIAYDLLRSVNTIDAGALESTIRNQQIKFLKKSFVESMLTTTSAVDTISKELLDSYIESIRDIDEPLASYQTKTRNGATFYDTRRHIIDDRKEIDKIAKSLYVDFQIEVERASTRKEIEQIFNNWGIPHKYISDEYKGGKFDISGLRKEILVGIRGKASKEYYSDSTVDLGTILKFFTVLKNTYKNTYQSESLINVAASMFDKKGVVDQTGYNETIELADGTYSNKTAAETNIREALDYQLTATFGGSRHGKGEVFKDRVYTKDEANEKKRLEAALADPKLSPALKEVIQEKINKLGKPAYYNSMVRGLVKFAYVLGMGWQLTTANANFFLGQTANMLEASAGRFFSRKSLVEATKLMRWSALKNWTFNKVQHPTATKVRNLIDRFNLVSDPSSELYKVSSLSPVSGWLRWAVPKQIQSRVEYVNQGQIILSYLIEHKVSEFLPSYKGYENLYEAFDIDGKWDHKKFGEIPLSTLSNILLNIKQVKTIMMGSYDYDQTVMIKGTLGGQLMMMYHSWIPEFVSARLGHEQKDSYTGVTTKGRYRTIGQLFSGTLAETDNGEKHSVADNVAFIFKNLLNQSNYDKRFTDFDAANMRAFLTEMAFLVTTYSGVLMLKALGNLDDDDKSNDTDNFLIYYLLNTSARLNKDIMFLMRTISGEEGSQRSIIPLMSLGTSLVKFIGSVGEVAWDAVADTDEEGLGNLRTSLMSFVPGATAIERTGSFLTTVKR